MRCYFIFLYRIWIELRIGIEKKSRRCPLPDQKNKDKAMRNKIKCTAVRFDTRQIEIGYFLMARAVLYSCKGWRHWVDEKSNILRVQDSVVFFLFKIQIVSHWSKENPNNKWIKNDESLWKVGQKPLYKSKRHNGFYPIFTLYAALIFSSRKLSLHYKNIITLITTATTVILKRNSAPVAQLVSAWYLYDSNLFNQRWITWAWVMPRSRVRASPGAYSFVFIKFM